MRSRDTVIDDLAKDLKAVLKDRQSQYQDPSINFVDIAAGWEAILHCKITKFQVARAMEWVKIVRDNNSGDKGFTDSHLDLAGYLVTILMMLETDKYKTGTVNKCPTKPKSRRLFLPMLKMMFTRFYR